MDLKSLSEKIINDEAGTYIASRYLSTVWLVNVEMGVCSLLELKINFTKCINEALTRVDVSF